jgi:hypothetical protein
VKGGGSTPPAGGVLRAQQPHATDCCNGSSVVTLISVLLNALAGIGAEARH